MGSMEQNPYQSPASVSEAKQPSAILRFAGGFIIAFSVIYALMSIGSLAALLVHPEISFWPKLVAFPGNAAISAFLFWWGKRVRRKYAIRPSQAESGDSSISN